MSAHRALLAGLLVLVLPVTLLAQDAKPRSDAAKSSMDDHMMGPWKEMNAFHKVMAATWHPASKGDLAPLRAHASDLQKAAEAWSASKAPATPATCASEAVKNAIGKVVTHSKAVAALLDAKAEDAKLKTALKELHDTFEIAEHACGGHGN